MKQSNYYFTFGTDERYPYRGGWVQIEAESLNQACQIFRDHYPDKVQGILNCADFYTEAQFERTGMAQDGNLGSYCHEVIRREEY